MKLSVRVKWIPIETNQRCNLGLTHYASNPHTIAHGPNKFNVKNKVEYLLKKKKNRLTQLVLETGETWQGNWKLQES